jgi:DNA-binding NtrC family response regulator
MRQLYEAAARAAQGTITVLLLGETGVGKEVLAREIHRRSPRAEGPFVVIDCAGLAESVLEGELFGHEKGAFTGAIEARPGLFEVADGGTAFLDEIGELPPGMQVKLLRVLEERTVLRIGGRAPRHVDVRFIAATNRDLAAEVERGVFRRDLFYRIHGMSLSLPPLRERPGEIADLAARFLAEECRKLDRAPAPALSEETLGLLLRHPWPGNVRELRHAVEHAVLLCAGDTLLPAHLPATITARSSGEGSAGADGVSGGAKEAGGARSQGAAPIPPAATVEELRATMDALERQRVVEALERCGGNQTRAAEMLGISRRTLVTRLGEYGLPRPRKRPEA